MKLHQIIFSPTGGTQKVGNQLALAMGGSVSTTDLTDCGRDFSSVQFGEEDLVIICVPSYGGRVPQLAVDRLAQLHGNYAQAVLVCVYGNRAYEDTLVELEDVAKQAGFCPVAAIAAVAEHSIAHRVAAGRPNAEDEKTLQEFAGRILEKIHSGQKTQPEIPGNRPYKKRGVSKIVPQLTGDCTRCGLCAKRCPAGAIDRQDPEKVENDRCISCMRCVIVCPQSARQIDKAALEAIETMLQKVCNGEKENELFL